MNPKDLKKVLTLARQYGLKSLSLEGVSFEFKEEQKAKALTNDNPVVVFQDKEDLEAKMPPDDEMLQYSTPFFDQIKKQRAEN